MKQNYYKHKITNLLNVSKIITIHYFKFNKNFKSNYESHDFWELVYAETAPIICTANDKTILLNKGELLFHKPNETHSLKADGKTSPNVFIVSFECKSEAIHFFENKVLKIDKELSNYVYDIIDESKKTFDLPYSNPDIKKMVFLEKPTLGGMQLIKNMLELFLIKLMRRESEGVGNNSTFIFEKEYGEFLVNEIINILKENLYSSITIEDICKELNYNKSYLFRQFKKITSTSIMNYYIALKITRAKELLKTTELSVKQISEMLCFDTPNYFSKCFKKHTNYTPLQYKKLR